MLPRPTPNVLYADLIYSSQQFCEIGSIITIPILSLLPPPPLYKYRTMSPEFLQWELGHCHAASEKESPDSNQVSLALESMCTLIHYIQ